MVMVVVVTMMVMMVMMMVMVMMMMMVVMMMVMMMVMVMVMVVVKNEPATPTAGRRTERRRWHWRPVAGTDAPRSFTCASSLVPGPQASRRVATPRSQP